jgi:glycosyltransferase involved in cell wall biosynthesis
VYESFPDAALVSISHAQRQPLPRGRWLGTVYNGIDVDRFQLREQPGDYLAFLGRISPEKRPDRAIEIARDVGMRLLIAAKIDQADRAYYDHAIKPLLRHPLVEFVGEIDEAQKDRFLGGAYAYLFPIDWPEPFGITMVEAMATGTPVITTTSGAAPEVVAHGVSGFVCNSMREMIAAVEKVGSLRRRDCREHVARHFTAAGMADGYEAIYRRLVQGEERAVGMG